MKISPKTEQNEILSSKLQALLDEYPLEPVLVIRNTVIEFWERDFVDVNYSELNYGNIERNDIYKAKIKSN